MIELTIEQREWIFAIENDEKSARSLLAHRDGSPSTICFLSQQTAEKSLKLLAVSQKMTLRKIHDLAKLASRLAKDFPDIKELKSNFALLDKYYTRTRYIGNMIQPDFGEAQAAFDVALRVKEFVYKKLGL